MRARKWFGIVLCLALAGGPAFGMNMKPLGFHISEIHVERWEPPVLSPLEYSVRDSRFALTQLAVSTSVFILNLKEERRLKILATAFAKAGRFGGVGSVYFDAFAGQNYQTVTPTRDVLLRRVGNFFRLEKFTAREHSHVLGWGPARVVKGYQESDFDVSVEVVEPISYRQTRTDPRPAIIGHDPVGVRCSTSSGCSSLVSLARQVEGEDQDTGADKNQDGLIEAVVSHLLSRFIHPLLGSKIVQFSLLGTLFAALAGLGLGLIFDNVNRERPRRLIGAALVGLSLPLCLVFLGLLAVNG